MTILIIRQLLKKHRSLPDADSNPLQIDIKPDLSLSSERAWLDPLNQLISCGLSPRRGHTPERPVRGPGLPPAPGQPGPPAPLGRSGPGQTRQSPRPRSAVRGAGPTAVPTSPTRRRWWSPWSQTPPTRAAGGESGRSSERGDRLGGERRGGEGGNTHFAVRRHLALLPGHPPPPPALRRRAQRLTGKRRRAVRAVPPRGRWSPPHGPSRPVSLPARLPSAAAEPPRPPGALTLKPAAGGDAPAGSSRARGWPKRLTGAAEETPAGPVTSRRCQAEAWVAPSGSPAPSAREGKRSALPAGTPCAGVPGRDWCRGLVTMRPVVPGTGRHESNTPLFSQPGAEVSPRPGVPGPA